MQYQTHIPTTAHAARETTFRERRAQARESLHTQRTVQSALIGASNGLLDRNYIDANRIHTMGRVIVQTSNTIRKLAPLANQPDPPRHEPATPDETQDENRTYAGIHAGRIVRVLTFLRNLRTRRGDVSGVKRVRRMSDRLVNGLDVYNRVKALIADLATALDAPETAMTPRSKPKPSISEEPALTPTFKWETSPHKIYGWERTRMAKGYNPRQTSVYWLEKQATALKRAVYKQYCGDRIVRKPRVARTKNYPQTIETKLFIPPTGSTLTDQIWPPIDLVRLIEERRSNPTCTLTCHSVQFAKRNARLDAEPRENLVRLNHKPHDNVSGSRIKLIARNKQCGMTKEMELETKTPPEKACPPPKA